MIQTDVVRALGIILAFQLLGEVISRGFGLPVPGPVLGLALILVPMLISQEFTDAIAPTATGLLAHLSLLFVPAGVGVIRHIETLGPDLWKVLVVVLTSTLLSIIVGTYTFLLVARWTGHEND